VFYVDLPDDPSVPAYMRGPRMTTLIGAVGAQLDANQEQVLIGRLQANPYAGGPSLDRSGAARLADGRLIECEPFVLPIHAQQRGIRLFASEGILSKRIRVSQHLPYKQQRGTHRGEMRYTRPLWAPDTTAPFAPLAYPTITIVHQVPAPPWGGPAFADWHTLSGGTDPEGTYSITRASPSNFDIDGRPTLRSRYAAFIDMSATGYTPWWTYGDGDTYGDGIFYGDGDTQPFGAFQAADAAAALADWKAAHSWLNWVVLWWPMTGGAPFPSASGTPTQDASGWYSLPSGASGWAAIADPVTGLATRPPNMLFVVDNPAP
jgi:hypothetical protein